MAARRFFTVVTSVAAAGGFLLAPSVAVAAPAESGGAGSTVSESLPAQVEVDAGEQVGGPPVQEAQDGPETAEAQEVQAAEAAIQTDLTYLREIPIDGVAAFGTAYDFATLPTDVDRERLLFRFSGEGASVASGEILTSVGRWYIEPATLEVSFTPLSGYAGSVDALGFSVSGPGGTIAWGNLFVEIDDLELTTADGSAVLPRGSRATFTPLVDLVTPGQSPVLGVELVDPVGGPTMADSIEVPGEGTWRIDDSTGVITFDPLASFVGEVTPLGYAAWDENGNSARAVLRVTYEAPPVPRDAVVPVPLPTTAAPVPVAPIAPVTAAASTLPGHTSLARTGPASAPVVGTAAAALLLLGGSFVAIGRRGRLLGDD